MNSQENIKNTHDTITDRRYDPVRGRSSQKNNE